MHTVKETDVLVTRMDLLLKRLDERAAEKRAMYGTVKAMDSHIMCEVCGSVGHSGNDCPETCGATAYINNKFSQQGGQNGWNHQLSLGKIHDTHYPYPKYPNPDPNYPNLRYPILNSDSNLDYAK
jgi:hypothetical protein